MEAAHFFMLWESLKHYCGTKTVVLYITYICKKAKLVQIFINVNKFHIHAIYIKELINVHIHNLFLYDISFSLTVYFLFSCTISKLCPGVLLCRFHVIIANCSAYSKSKSATTQISSPDQMSTYMCCWTIFEWYFIKLHRGYIRCLVERS